MWGPSEKAAVYNPRSLRGNQPRQHLELGLPASRMRENKFLLFKPRVCAIPLEKPKLSIPLKPNFFKQQQVRGPV